jgi:1-acyl-sn-glycerol-3-phosphate acyltransferase
LVLHILLGWIWYLPAVAIQPARDRPLAKATWLQDVARRVLPVLGVRISVQGLIPGSGLLVSNHLSYLDVLVLAALAPSVFVAKREVKSWPVFGWFASLAGTIFVDRQRKCHTSQTNTRMTRLLEDRQLVILFPEGTSTDGRTVLPFRSSLLEPAATLGCNTTVACLNYYLEDGNVPVSRRYLTAAAGNGKISASMKPSGAKQNPATSAHLIAAQADIISFREATRMGVRLVQAGSHGSDRALVSADNPFCGLLSEEAGNSKPCSSWPHCSATPATPDKPLVERCQAGLVHVIIPVVRDGLHLANLEAGQVFSRQPTEADFHAARVP